MHCTINLSVMFAEHVICQVYTSDLRVYKNFRHLRTHAIDIFLWLVTLSRTQIILKLSPGIKNLDSHLRLGNSSLCTDFILLKYNRQGYSGSFWVAKGTVLKKIILECKKRCAVSELLPVTSSFLWVRAGKQDIGIHMRLAALAFHRPGSESTLSLQSCVSHMLMRALSCRVQGRASERSSCLSSELGSRLGEKNLVTFMQTRFWNRKDLHML